MAETEADDTFKLNNSSGKFAAKTNDIFGCLSVIEKKYEADQKTHSEDDDLCKPDPMEEDMSCISGAGSRGTKRKDLNKPYCRPQDTKHTSFAMPDLPPARSHRGRRSAPDHRQNPDRWTKYTLEDVPGTEMSESSNTQAAFAFLEERRKLRELAEDPDSFVPANVADTACSKGAITFVRKKSNKAEASEKKNQGCVLPRLDEDDSEDKEDGPEGVEKDSSPVKVSFKSKKGQRKNIRSRQEKDDDEDNEDNG